VLRHHRRRTRAGLVSLRGTGLHRPPAGAGGSKLFARRCHQRRQDDLACWGNHLADENDKSLAGDVDGQIRFIFREIERTLAKQGGKLSDIVTMTVFLTDARYRDRLSKVRNELFAKPPPASAQITVSALAVPGFVVEVQAIAVVGDD
jgi:enamine deaminase RidA (YjgF/YER057c/UK114 family)